MMPNKVYLQPEALKHSGHHTAYVGDGPYVKPGEAGQPGQAQLVKLEFFGGVAQNVDDERFKRFKDAGIADTKRPAYARRDD